MRPSKVWSLLLVFIPALVLRIVVLSTNSVSFHSDEAIVGLMARHIIQGDPIPTFFYGQPYMGSLDSILVSLMFRLTGENVLSIRLVQSILYLCIVGTTALLAYRLTEKLPVALIAGLLIAIPPVVLTLYSTASLGGYGETLLLGNLVLLFGYEAARTWRLRDWLALGFVAGLGWWTNALIIVYLLPVGVWVVSPLTPALSPTGREREIRSFTGSPLSLRLRGGKGMGVRGVFLLLSASLFLLGSLPWWVYNITHDGEAFKFLFGGYQLGGVAPSIADKAAGFVILGLPAVMGLRFPWTPTPWPGSIGLVIGLSLYLVLLILSAIFTLRQRNSMALLWLMVILFAGVFILSGFGIDATGRYLLPLVVPLAILLAAQISQFPRILGLSLMVVLVGINLWGTMLAIRNNPPGLTPQFDPSTDIPNDADQAVIDFLLQHGGQYGYATYWAAYRLDFLSHEQVILSPLLPYKEPFTSGGPDRYPAYTDRVNAAQRPVFVTANLPDLDQRLAAQFTRHQITFEQKTIGKFTVFYNLSAHVSPQEINLQN